VARGGNALVAVNGFADIDKRHLDSTRTLTKGWTAVIETV